MVLLNSTKTQANPSGLQQGQPSQRERDQPSQQGQGGPGQGGRRKRSKPPFQGYGKTFLELNSDHLQMYHVLQKEERIWRGQGQHWLANEAKRRYTSLLDGDVEGSKTVSVSCGPCRQLRRECVKEAEKHRHGPEEGLDEWTAPMREVPSGCSCMDEYQNLFVKTKKSL